ncbi:MAG TPA: hypothetical protein VMN56_19525 [Casimicrobiaceae bacterium]|nr:hypothetical protein [Casimicrobiaceae bacterium]
MNTRLSFAKAVIALAACSVAAAAAAQSTGGFGGSSSGAAAAGGSPVGMVLPWTVQTGSTAPTQPGHTMARSDPDSTQVANRGSDRSSRVEAAGRNGDRRVPRDELASASAPTAPR